MSAEKENSRAKSSRVGTPDRRWGKDRPYSGLRSSEVRPQGTSAGPTQVDPTSSDLDGVRGEKERSHEVSLTRRYLPYSTGALQDGRTHVVTTVHDEVGPVICRPWTACTFTRAVRAYNSHIFEKHTTREIHKSNSCFRLLSGHCVDTIGVNVCTFDSDSPTSGARSFDFSLPQAEDSPGIPPTVLPAT